MHACYDVARVQAYSATGSMRLVVRLPLIGTDRLMILYWVESLSTYSVLKRPIQIQPKAKYFVVTENRQYYALVEETHIRHCEQGLITICDATFSINS
jgi:hypothetical protein